MLIIIISHYKISSVGKLLEGVPQRILVAMLSWLVASIFSIKSMSKVFDFCPPIQMGWSD